MEIIIYWMFKLQEKKTNLATLFPPDTEWAWESLVFRIFFS